jgi:hypothetical protein
LVKGIGSVARKPKYLDKCGFPCSTVANYASHTEQRIERACCEASNVGSWIDRARRTRIAKLGRLTVREIRCADEESLPRTSLKVGISDVAIERGDRK